MHAFSPFHSDEIFAAKQHRGVVTTRLNVQNKVEDVAWLDAFEDEPPDFRGPLFFNVCNAIGHIFKYCISIATLTLTMFKCIQSILEFI